MTPHFGEYNKAVVWICTIWTPCVPLRILFCFVNSKLWYNKLSSCGLQFLRFICNNIFFTNNDLFYIRLHKYYNQCCVLQVIMMFELHLAVLLIIEAPMLILALDGFINQQSNKTILIRRFHGISDQINKEREAKDAVDGSMNFVSLILKQVLEHLSDCHHVLLTPDSQSNLFPNNFWWENIAYFIMYLLPTKYCAVLWNC